MEIEKEIGELLHAYQKSCILMTANSLKVFDAIAGKPVSAETVASLCKLSFKGTERLLNALAVMGIVERTNGSYHLPAEWAKYLAKSGDHCMQDWVQLSADLLPVWLELPQFIRTGKHVKKIMDVLGTEPDKMRAFIDAMHDKGMKATWMLAREIPVGDAKHMLDVGGGPGTYSLEWAKLHNHLKATIFDIPPVLEVAKDYIHRYKLQDRVDTQPGDFTKDDLGSGYDLVLLANVLHMYDEISGKGLVQNAVNALDPGGRIVIHGFCTNEDESGPLNDIIFNLNIGMLTEGGRAHPVKEKIGWLEEAGVADIRHFRIQAIPTGVITGIKAG